MPKVDEYRRKLQELGDWTPYLLKNSGLPGPRGNLELAQAVAELASLPQVEILLKTPPELAPENSAEVFPVFCGITALGKIAARGDARQLKRLRDYASDPRWRVREAVAIALQYVGDADMHSLLTEMKNWSAGNWFEKRAAAAALAEPRLLKDPDAALQALQILDKITADISSTDDRSSESFKVLRQSMGYCWSVAVAALPKEGKALMQKWMGSRNPDIRWVMKENLKKARLVRIDPVWVKTWEKKLGEETRHVTPR